jgi:DNA-binding response OmpR family regulator
MADDSILVVDDSPTILKLVQLVLTKGGYRVATASSGEAGLLAAKEDPPALILLDYLMPEMNGDDVCRAMSADTVLCRVPVIVMSARDDEVGEQFARLPNVVDHITKPFSPDALLTVIAHTLAKSGAPPASVDAPVLHALPRTEPAPEDLSGASGESALAGDLALISIADVLALLQDQAQTGVLTLTHAQARLDIYLRSGRIDLAVARGAPEEFLLGRFLVEAGHLSEATLAAVIEDRKVGPRPAGLLGADLVARRLVSADQLRQAMSQQTAALVYEGLRWGAGRFRFRVNGEDFLPEPAMEARLGMSVDGLIMEGLRRVDEWRLIEREIGDFDMVFVRNEDKLATFGRGRLLRDEVTVLEFVNGKNSVRDIIGLTRMGSFDVTKMLYRLLRNKLIRRRVAAIAV